MFDLYDGVFLLYFVYIIFVCDQVKFFIYMYNSISVYEIRLQKSVKKEIYKLLGILKLWCNGGKCKFKKV